MAISELDLPLGVVARSLSDPAQLADALAAAVAEALRTAIATQGTATLVVSGGRSPVAFFQRLAQQQLPWSQVVVSLADERWVGAEHADSNEALVRRYLLQGPAAAARLLGQALEKCNRATPAGNHQGRDTMAVDSRTQRLGHGIGEILRQMLAITVAARNHAQR
jgi:6-phosphogluconolactonase/glucosamine-6-phosphate isomerase/deaminase